MIIVAMVDEPVYNKNMNSVNESAKRPVREKILHTAHDLFYRDGIRATGVDKVIAESGVSKVTFYRHFPSKRDLILAYLDYRHHRWIHWFKEALARHGGKPGAGLKPLVATLEEWFDSPLYRGCAFINTTAELADTWPEALEICRSHKRDMTLIIAELLPESPDRMQLAQAAAVAVDGAIITAQLEQSSENASSALLSLALILQAIDL